MDTNYSFTESESFFLFIMYFHFMEKVYIGRRKVGANIIDYRNKKYIVVTFNQKNSKFPFPYELNFTKGKKSKFPFPYGLNLTKEKLVHLICLSIKYSFENFDQFKLNLSKMPVTNLLLHDISNDFTEGSTIDFGDILSYNQYFYLLNKPRERGTFIFDGYFSSLLNIKSDLVDIDFFHERHKFSKTFFQDLDEIVQLNLMNYLAFSRFTSDKSITLIDWILNHNELFEDLVTYYEVHLSKHLSTIFKYSLDEEYLKSRLIFNIEKAEVRIKRWWQNNWNT